MNIPKYLNAVIEIKFDSLEDAEVVLKTIEPELKSAPSSRSSVRASLEGNVLNLKIEAEDTHIFRASLNSYLRWIILSHEVGMLKIT
jgi:KEOPS complex subunit Pcc1